MNIVYSSSDGCDGVKLLTTPETALSPSLSGHVVKYYELHASASKLLQTNTLIHTHHKRAISYGYFRSLSII